MPWGSIMMGRAWRHMGRRPMVNRRSKEIMRRWRTISTEFPVRREGGRGTITSFMSGFGWAVPVGYRGSGSLVVVAMFIIGTHRTTSGSTGRSSAVNIT